MKKIFLSIVSILYVSFILILWMYLNGCDIGLKIKDIKQLNALLDGGIKIHVNINTDVIPDSGLVVHVEGIPEDIPIHFVYELPEENNNDEKDGGSD